MPWAGLAIGAGLGLLKSELVDVPKAQRQRVLAAATQRYSPWTHLAAAPVQEADPFSTALQFGGLGASLAGAKQQSDSENAYRDALTNQANQGNLIGGGGGSGGQNNFFDSNPYSGDKPTDGSLSQPWSGDTTQAQPQSPWNFQNVVGKATANNTPGAWYNDTRGGWMQYNPSSIG